MVCLDMNGSPSVPGPDHGEAYRRARMRSRRGLLELDLFLVPFVEACYEGLAAGLQRDYDELLLEEDTDILDWLKGEPVSNARFVLIIERIRGWHFRDAPRE